MTESDLEQGDLHSASPEYKRRFSGVAGEWMLSVQNRILKNLIGDAHSVLDIGGGHGQIAAPLIELQKDVTVFGSSVPALEQVKVLSEQQRCKIASGNLLHLPFPDKSFDIVTSFRLLPHCTQWQRLLSEMCRVAKHSVIVDYPAVQSVNFLSPLLFKIKHAIEGNTRPYTLFSHNEVRAIFKAYGFSVRDHVPEFFFPMVIHRVLKNPSISKAIETAAEMLGLTRYLGSPVIIKAIRG